MDKALVNNQIVLMRKIVRNVKRFVSQKILKQIKVLQIKQNKKNDQKLIAKIDNKIANKKKELNAVKGANVDDVSKQALLNDGSHFDNIIKSNDSSFEEKAIARIAIHEHVVKAVKKFKEENPNCDLWLPSQIELWQQKKLMKRNKFLKKKNAQKENVSKNEETNENTNQLINNNNNNDDDDDNNNNKINDNNESMKPELDSTEPKKLKEKVKKKNKKAVVKRIQVQKNDSQISLGEDSDNDEVNETLEDDEKEENEEKKNIKPKVDPFFLSDDLNEEQPEENTGVEETTFNRNNKFRKRDDFTQRSNRKQSRYAKPGDGKMKPNSDRYPKSRINDHKQRNVKQKQYENHESSQKSRGRDKTAQSWSKSTESNTEKMHPSWAARRQMKEKFKVNFDQKPVAKKIKFNDN